MYGDFMNPTRRDRASLYCGVVAPPLSTSSTLRSARLATVQTGRRRDDETDCSQTLVRIQKTQSSGHRATAIGINARMRTLITALVLLSLAGPAAATVARGFEPVAAEAESPARVFADGMSLDQAVAMVQARHKARVMRANTVDEGGKTVHYIRLMSADGSRVWTVRVDASTGREF